MSRIRLAALLLGLATPLLAQAQAPEPAVWTVASGDYTVYGRTIYTAVRALVPRIVFDTAHRMDSTRVVDSVRAGASEHAGLAAGMSAWPADSYCGGPLSGAMQPLEAHQLLARVQLAAECSFRLVIVPPRRRITTTGTTVGVFSVDSAKRLMDRYALALPPDTIRKYRATLLGLNLADDYGCAECWGGRKITQGEVAEWARYAREQLPGIPLGVRVTPDWVARDPGLAPLLDYAWAQYHTKKGEARAFYDGSAELARTLGLRLVMGVNVEDCYGVGTAPCTAEDLVRYGTMAASHPASCAFINWRYDPDTWARPEIRAAWDGLLAIARSRPAQECRRWGGQLAGDKGS
jgi:hypothetical protein